MPSWPEMRLRCAPQQTAWPEDTRTSPMGQEFVCTPFQSHPIKTPGAAKAATAAHSFGAVVTR